MSKLKNLIRQTVAIQGELVSSTIRLPRELNDFVEEFAEQHAKSKQEILLTFLEEGINIAKEELVKMETDVPTVSCAFQLLNTNKGNSLEEHNMILGEGIAAAFYDPWKLNIARINKGDVVFLYENGVGVVAYGVGTGKTLVRDHQNAPEECHYQQLEGFTKLKKPIPAKEVRLILGYPIVFMRTMMGMPGGQKLLDAIHKQLSNQ